MKDLEELLSILEPAKIVGGAVRNSLLGLGTTDLDIATVHTPDNIIRIASTAGFRVIPTGLKHGTVTCLKSNSYEVTTLRIDRETDGRHAVVEFSNSWEEDAHRRDFTINALYSDFDGKIYDFVGGLSDIYQKTLRFIGIPSERIQEDYLRILRFFRFLARYCDQYDQASLDACLALAPHLTKISRERCTSEFFKLLSGDKNKLALSLMSPEILSSSGLPLLKESTLELINTTLYEHSLSLIGKIACFDTNHNMVLSRKESKLLHQLYNLKTLNTSYDYKFWINTSAETLWDGFILKGQCNEIIPSLEKWFQNKFQIQGQDLIKLGYKSGPIIGQAIKELMELFCSYEEPPSMGALLEKYR